MTSESQKKASKKYDAKNTRTYSLKLNKKYDMDIIDYLESVDNVQGELKNIIRYYLEIS